MLKTVLTPLTPVAAAIGASFLQQVWWVRGIEGAAFGAIVFVFIPLAINWASSRSNFVTLRVDCAVDFLPTTLPSEGRVTVVQLRYAPEVPHQAGQVSQGYGAPGQNTEWPPRTQAHKCEVRNIGTVSVFDVAVTLTVNFREVVRSPSNPVEWVSGGVIGTGNVSIVAPRLEEKIPFSFYVTNTSPHVAVVAAISAGYAWPGDGTRPRLILNLDPMRLMNFAPAGT